MPRPSGRGHERGLTLVEMAVALAVAGLVSLAIFGLFRIGFAFHRRSTQAIAPWEAAIGLDVIVRSFREGGREGEVFHGWSSGSDGARYDAVAIRTARTPQGFVIGDEGLPQWRGWIGFFHDPLRRAVVRIDFPEGQDVSPPPWSGGRIVARQAKAFLVQKDADRYMITLLFEGEGTSLALTTTVWPRNR